jgi:hypothetical protein
LVHQHCFDSPAAAVEWFQDVVEEVHLMPEQVVVVRAVVDRPTVFLFPQAHLGAGQHGG